MSRTVILFDLDGVLVDVRASYHAAIRDTAEFFTGEGIGEEEIRSFKNRGGFNDDWDLTAAIVASRGKTVPRTAIIDQFQSRYLGRDFDGLIRHETWIADNRQLSRLQARFKTGIVTGRPRPEAEYALRRFDADSLFDVLVTLEETPGEFRKPSPFGIRLALSRLGASSGVYFGDSVDDMTAAVSAGITAIGVLTADSPAGEQESRLRKSGARIVLTHIDRFEEALHATGID
jgi:HAD superfamily hydrolase (TIGR01548 family)